MRTNARATKYIFALLVVSRRLQEEEQQLRTSSLPAIPNPFPELCSPASSPVLSPGSLPPGEPPTGNYVSCNVTVVHYWGIHKTTKMFFFFCFYLKGCLCGFNILAAHYNFGGAESGCKTWSQYRVAFLFEKQDVRHKLILTYFCVYGCLCDSRPPSFPLRYESLNIK